MEQTIQTNTGRKRNKIIKRIVLFVSSAILIAYFFPRDIQFRYTFIEGKPWKYEFLTAPFDFPIYKSEEVLKNEKDSITDGFNPYFRIEKQIQTDNLKQLRADYFATLHRTIPLSYLNYIEKQLTEIYNKGIIHAATSDSLIRSGKKLVRLAEDNIYKSHAINQMYTATSAYETIINEAPATLDKELLKSCNLNNYIHENLFLDSKTSEKMLQAMLEHISLASGLVQSGERIVDKGEIISPTTYSILHSLKQVSDSQKSSKTHLYTVFIGQLFIIGIMLFSLYLFLLLFRIELFRSVRDISFILMLVVVLIVVTCIAVSTRFLTVYLIPFSILPIILCTFFDSRTALFTHMVTVMTASFITPFPFEFLTMQIAAGMTAVFSLRDLTQRSQLVTSAMYIFLTYCLIYTGVSLIQEGDWSKINISMYGALGINSALIMFAYVLIYIFERTFGYLSTVTLIELQNINNPALRKLSEECPGTFQHSLQVGTLAYEAARHINANAQMVRTGAFYHDLGKMKNPAFFAENQVGINPHNELSFDESAQIIISHVNDGVKLAEKYNLPLPLIDFIRTHHGANKVRFFYNSFKNKYPDKEIDESLFTYPGPIPFSKETAILMMADAVEATSRSLQEYTDESISSLVENTIDTQIAEGAFKNSPITFKDVERVKNVFKKRLKIIYHTRIKYPELKEKRTV
ncbi:MAG: HDIG domain-containing protein [Bacteroidales bacterium]|nr:HDIG domain-containing protein [Bacteroidales bacterium]